MHVRGNMDSGHAQFWQWKIIQLSELDKGKAVLDEKKPGASDMSHSLVRSLLHDDNMASRLLHNNGLTSNCMVRLSLCLF